MIRLSPIPAAAAVTTIGMLPAYLTGAQAVQMRSELGLRPGALGAIVAGAFLAAAAGSMAGGRLADRVGATPVMRAACLIAAASALAVGSVVADLRTLAVAVVLGGLSNGIGQPASNVLLARAVPPRRQGMAYGVKQAATPTAVLLGSLAVPAVALTVGWRWSFLVAAAIALLVAALLPRDPRSATPPGLGRDATPVPFLPLLVLAAGGTLGAAAGNALAAFLIDSSVAAGLAPGLAGLLASLGSATGVATRLLMGVRADRRAGGHLRTVGVMMALGAVGFGLLAVADSWLLVPAVVASYVFGWSWPGLYHFGVARRHPGSAGRATGFTQTGVALGGALGPLAFGLLAERSYATAWLVAAAWSLSAAAAVLVGRRLLLRVQADSASPGRSVRAR
jgi:MFS family permease